MAKQKDVPLIYIILSLEYEGSAATPHARNLCTSQLHAVFSAIGCVRQDASTTTLQICLEGTCAHFSERRPSRFSPWKRGKPLTGQLKQPPQISILIIHA